MNYLEIILGLVLVTILIWCFIELFKSSRAMSKKEPSYAPWASQEDLDKYAESYEKQRFRTLVDDYKYKKRVERAALQEMADEQA